MEKLRKLICAQYSCMRKGAKNPARSDPEIQQKKVSKIVYEMHAALRGATSLYRNPAAP